MSLEIIEIYFVRKNGIDFGENVLYKFVPKPFESTKVEPGKTYRFNPVEVGFVPIKGKSEVRDLILFLKGGDKELKPVRYREVYHKKKGSSSVSISLPNPMWEYRSKTRDQLEEWYETKDNYGIIDFGGFEKFLTWYNDKVKDKSCKYCGITERECQEVVHNGLLTSNRFMLYGISSKGVNRGYWLEIDRKNPKGKYSEANCVPSCYFCNNDKSDVFNEEQYLEFFQNRLRFIKGLLNH